MSKDYSDIIDHPNYKSAKRQPMTMLNRAAQFSPFAALVGFDLAVEETARLTEERITLDEAEIQILNGKIAEIKPGDEVHITYFQPDPLKSGGMYLPLTGNVKKVDHYEGKLVFTDGSSIPLSDIFDLEIAGKNEMF